MIMKEKSCPQHNVVEKSFEWILRNSRFMVLIPVLISMLMFILLIIGILIKFWHLVEEIIRVGFTDKVLSGVISILDVSLLAVIILIFAWWIYELFVSEIDVDDEHVNKAKSLIIRSIDELKEKIWKVIIILLIVWLFKQMILQIPQNRWDILILAWAILIMALALKFISGKK